MKKKEGRKTVRKILLSILTVIVVVGLVYTRFGGFGTGACADVNEIRQYALTVNDLEIPEETRIVALGEATHGNVEFQQLKKEVFQEMVERYGVRSFVLEADYGGCAYVNRYIHGGEGTALSSATAIGFALYRTQEMEELIEWMRTYNQTAAEGEDLRFYGNDMQRIAYNGQYLIEGAEALQVDAGDFKQIWTGESFKEGVTKQEMRTVLTALRDTLLALSEEEAAHTAQFAEILLQNLDLGDIYETDVNGQKSGALRDQMMAKNTLWILEQEEMRGHERIFVSCHNGHMEEEGAYLDDAGKVMGNLLADAVGKDAYYAIGTDFYRTDCNLPKSDGTRITKTFYSYDPIAKGVAKAGYDIALLDFAKIPDDAGLRSVVDSYMNLGSLGEGYSFVMHFLPMTYRVYRAPSSMYDAMIYVAHAHPTTILAQE